MYPPAFVCRKLYELDPQIRLAWLGFKPRYAGELNPGTFCIVQLWKKDHFGSHERPNTPNELWNVQPVRLSTGDVEMRRVDRGPVFNKDAGTRPDWNVLAHEVVYRANLKDFGISLEDVMSGAILHKLGRFYRPLKERIEEDERERQWAMRHASEEMGREAGKRLHRALNDCDVRLPQYTMEDQLKALAAQERRKQNHLKDLL